MGLTAKLRIERFPFQPADRADAARITLAKKDDLIARIVGEMRLEMAELTRRVLMHRQNSHGTLAAIAAGIVRLKN